MGLEAVAKRVYVGRFDGKASGHGVTSGGNQVGLMGTDEFDDVDARDRPGRSFGDIIFAADNDGGTVVGFNQFARD